MKTVLFVDDQPEVLRALRRTLGSLQDEWELLFAESGAEGLELLAEHQCDVVVTDMQMPGMNGAQLLEHASRDYPDTVRIVLSGEAKREDVLRAVKPMHQYLAKPCDANSLLSTVNRALALHELLSDQQLKKLVSQLSSLPTLPTVYTELTVELDSSEGSIEKIGEIVSADIALTAKILQLANSAIFGLRREVSNPAQAASLLGIETIKSLVLSAGVFSQFQESQLGSFPIDRIMNHSLAVATEAKAIARDKGSPEMSNDSFTAGLLHDVGKLVLAAIAPSDYGTVLRTAAELKIPTWQADQEVFGASHAEVGAYLLGLWGLPESIVEATAFHHWPERCPHDEFRPLDAVCAANVHDHQLEASGDHKEEAAQPDQNRDGAAVAK